MTNTDTQSTYPDAGVPGAELPENGSDDEHQDRRSLACAFQLAERFGFHEGICNHFSLRLNGSSERYLINPYGVHWSLMRPDTLLMIDGEGQLLAGDGCVEDTARFIHVAAHRANPRHKVVLHTHMPYATTLAMLDGASARLSMAHQTAIRFHGRIAYENKFGGLAQSIEEGNRMAKNAEKSPQTDILFLANHGVVVSGSSVAMAFDDLYYLERACRQHVLALQTGAPLKLIPDNIVQLTAQQFHRDMPEFAEQHFSALRKVLQRSPEHNFTF